LQGQTQIRCRDCGRTAGVSGEMPREYSECFAQVVRRDGWVVAPGNKVEFLCGSCLRNYEGSETRDDADKI